MANLSVNFLGTDFENPTVLASGVLGVTAATWKSVVKSGAGGITTKSIWLNEHIGHPNPTIITTEHWMMNAVGLPDAGLEKAKEEIEDYIKEKPAPLIVSIVAGKVDEFAQIAEEISKLPIDIIEVNISCPNVEDKYGMPFACVSADAKKVTEGVKKVAGEKTVVAIAINVLLLATRVALVSVAHNDFADKRFHQPILRHETGCQRVNELR